MAVRGDVRNGKLHHSYSHLGKTLPLNPQAIVLPGFKIVPATRLRIRWFVVGLYVASIALTIATFTARPAIARVTAGCDVLALMLLVAWVRPSKGGV